MTADILFVGFLTGHGGDANQMQLLAHGMHVRGARVKVLVPEMPTSVAFAERCRELGLECGRSPLIRADLTGPRQVPGSMVKLVRSFDSPIVHFHTGNSCLPRTVMGALELARAPRSFVTVQSPYETIDPRSLRARWWAVLAGRRLHAVVSPSDHGTRFQQRCGLAPERTVTLRNAIDTTAIAGGDGTAVRAELGIGADDPLIVFTSRLDSQKRPVDAVKIFHGVADEFPTASLAFVGIGAESDRVAACASELGIADRVHMVGFRTDVADWLAASTVWILPTERENFSVAVLEALAAGCAVLSTSCPGNDEVLVDGDNALVFPIGDVATAEVKLRHLLSDAVLRQRLGQGGRTSASGFSVEHMVDEYAALYDRFGVVPDGLALTAR